MAPKKRQAEQQHEKVGSPPPPKRGRPRKNQDSGDGKTQAGLSFPSAAPKDKCTVPLQKEESEEKQRRIERAKALHAAAFSQIHTSLRVVGKASPYPPNPSVEDDQEKVSLEEESGKLVAAELDETMDPESNETTEKTKSVSEEGATSSTVDQPTISMSPGPVHIGEKQACAPEIIAEPCDQGPSSPKASEDVGIAAQANDVSPDASVVETPVSSVPDAKSEDVPGVGIAAKADDVSPDKSVVETPVSSVPDTKCEEVADTVPDTADAQESVPTPLGGSCQEQIYLADTIDMMESQRDVTETTNTAVANANGHNLVEPVHAEDGDPEEKELRELTQKVLDHASFPEFLAQRRSETDLAPDEKYVFPDPTESAQDLLDFNEFLVKKGLPKMNMAFIEWQEPPNPLDPEEPLSECEDEKDGTQKVKEETTKSEKKDRVPIRTTTVIPKGHDKVKKLKMTDIFALAKGNVSKPKGGEMEPASDNNDDNEYESNLFQQIKLAKKHRLFRSMVESTIEECQLEEGEWIFGDDDAEADLESFLDYLKRHDEVPLTDSSPQMSLIEHQETDRLVKQARNHKLFKKYLDHRLMFLQLTKEEFDFGNPLYAFTDLCKFNEYMSAAEEEQLDLTLLQQLHSDDHQGPYHDDGLEQADTEELKVFLTESGCFDCHDFLVKMARLYIRKVCACGVEFVDLPAVMNVASLCSGPGTGELTLNAAVQELSDHFLLPATVKVVMACEREGWKQQHLAHHIVPSSCCIYDDVMTLGSAAAHFKQKDDSKGSKGNAKDDSIKAPFCVHHRAECNPMDKEIFMLKSGFSCKGNSRMNSRFAEFRESMKMGDFSNSSVSTFYGTLGMIEWSKPKVFVLENVDSAGGESQQDSNLARVMEELRTVDNGMYEAHVYHLATSDYILPQNRNRIYIVGYRLDGFVTNKPPEDFFEEIGYLLEAMKTPTLPVQSLLLADDDPDLQAELHRREAFRKDVEKKAETADTKDMKWVGSHMDACEARGLPWPPHVPQHLKNNRWLAAAPQREQEIINITALDSDVAWVDASQNMSRVRGSKNQNAPTILPNCHLFHYPTGRFLVGSDLMRLQGFPSSILHGGTHTQAQLSDLAGNMFSSSVSLAVDIAVLCAIECEQMNGDAAMDTTTQLCRLLHMCGDSLEMTDDADEFVL